ncbi:hypothetical protein OBBRIDRAFT_527505 [Obba rivulosa]|uniref:Uncharacterized protein n=1 Tax=Obba rivulosa TaxID=1052685 RepID=A0A8E2DMS2_9APHY|nr:hypothetical protein OBBRIDRAFT_527505 [Obba rivulosa]
MDCRLCDTRLPHHLKLLTSPAIVVCLMPTYIEVAAVIVAFSLVQVCYEGALALVSHSCGNCEVTQTFHGSVVDGSVFYFLSGPKNFVKTVYRLSSL